MSAELPVVIGHVVGDPRALLDDDLPRLGLARLAPMLLGLTVASAAVAGASIGAFHGGLQVPYAAVKLPLVLVMPSLVIVPAARALASLFNVVLDAERVTVATLGAVARVGIFAMALAPVLAVASGPATYRPMVLLVVSTLALAGLAGLGSLWTMVPAVAGLYRRLLVLTGVALLLGVVGAQSGWMLRPFVLHRALPVTFLEKPRSDVFTEVERRLAGKARARRPDLPPIDEETRATLEAHGYVDAGPARRETRGDAARAELSAIGYVE